MLENIWNFIKVANTSRWYFFSNINSFSSSTNPFSTCNIKKIVRLSNSINPFSYIKNGCRILFLIGRGIIKKTTELILQLICYNLFVNIYLILYKIQKLFVIYLIS